MTRTERTVLLSLFLSLFSFSEITAQQSISCPSYDPSKIKLVTFDCFAALMNWEESMLKNTAEILPQLSQSQLEYLVYSWEDGYGSYWGNIFEEGETGSFPFSHSIASSLKSITQNEMNLNLTRNEFNDMMMAWGRLTPWPGTQESLEILMNAKLTLGVLSNGDYRTLRSDASMLAPPVHFKHVFSSDFPVGAFKPQPPIYQQTLSLGYDISEILHVAGGSGDASGARDAGLFSVYLAKTGIKKNGQPLFRELASSSQPCFTISDISELPAVLGL